MRSPRSCRRGTCPPARSLARREVAIEVAYDGPDLADVCSLTGLSPDDVVRLHTAPDYTVAFLGFSPGFPYLLGLDPRLAVPRLDSPRVAVPPGSVGIGGEQTGVYPSATPGGWRLIGHTDAALFDPHPRPAGPAERRRHRALRRHDDRLTVVVARAAHLGAGPRSVRPRPLRGARGRGARPRRLEAAPTAPWATRPEPPASNASCAAPRWSATPSGRWPWWEPGGPSGRQPVAAGVPYTVSCAAGLRCWVGVGGGLDTPVVLGSRSTDTLSGLGGRVLRAGDTLELGATRARTRRSWRGRLCPRARWSFGSRPVRTPTGSSGRPGRGAPSRSARAATARRVRLEGPAVSRHGGEIATIGVLPGAVQLPRGRSADRAAGQLPDDRRLPGGGGGLRGGPQARGTAAPRERSYGWSGSRLAGRGSCRLRRRTDRARPWPGPRRPAPTRGRTGRTRQRAGCRAHRSGHWTRWTSLARARSRGSVSATLRKLDPGRTTRRARRTVVPGASALPTAHDDPEQCPQQDPHASTMPGLAADRCSGGLSHGARGSAAARGRLMLAGRLLSRLTSACEIDGTGGAPH